MDGDHLVEDDISELQEALTTAIDSAADRATRRLLRHRRRLLLARRNSYLGFEERLYWRWAEALDLYELCLYLAHQCGEKFEEAFRAEAAVRQDYKFEALSRLHGIAALNAGEVLTLLKAGYASGAHARWRSLHETSVLMMFLNDSPPEVAERFVHHRIVKAYEDAQTYQQYADRLGGILSTEEMSELRNDFDAVMARYGPGFEGSFGWARKELESRNPGRKGQVRFGDIERIVGVDFWLPYFRMASHAVHPTATSIAFNIGLPPETPLLLAGPTNAGLADPGHGALRSLLNATASLMTHALAMTLVPESGSLDQIMGAYQPSLSLQAMTKAMSALADAAGAAFLQTHQELEAEEAELRLAETPDSRPAECPTPRAPKGGKTGIH